MKPGKNPFLTMAMGGLALLTLSLASQHAAAATMTKADNSNDLNLSSSWAGGVVPGAFDVASWDSTVTGPNSTLLGANQTWGGISLSNPGGAVTIGGANTLTLGGNGIDMSAATQNLTLSSSLTLASGGQVWNVASGRTLTLNTGTFTRSAGAALNIQGTGTVAASMTGIANVNAILGPWATVGSGSSTRYATLAAGNITSFTTGTAAAAFGWTSGNNNTFNYDVANVQTVLGVARQANTARYTGPAGTQLWGNNNTTNITLNGLLNAGTGTLTFSENGGTSNGQLAIGTNNGNELVLGAANADITIKIPIVNTGANAGSVLITGPGTVTIDSAGGNSSYTGATTVASGTLLLNGAGNINTTSGITINGNSAKYTHASSVASTRAITLTRGTLDGTGSVGAVTVADNSQATLTNGNGGTTALTMASLALSGDATMNLKLGSGVGLNVTGTLSTTPASGTVLVNATKTGWVLGSNNLVGFGSFSGSATDFTLGTVTGLGARQVAGALSVSGGFLSLGVSGDLPVWTGVNGSGWTTVSSGDNSGSNNWATKTAQTGTNFWSADTPEFNDTYNLGAGAVAVSNRAVDIQGANVTPGVVTFNNSTGDYTLSSSTGHGISGAASLVKGGTSKLTISNANTFTGSTTINGGTLQLGNGVTDGSIASTSAITNNGTLAYNNTGALTQGVVISGTGNLTKAGNGVLTLTAANTYQGGTTITGGAITVNGAGSLGSGAISVGAGTNLNLNTAVTLGSAVSGSGSITTTSTTTVNGDFSGFTGTFTHNTSTASTAFNTANSTSAGAAYVIATNQGSAQGLIAGGNGNYTLQIGSLSGVANSLFRGGNVATGTTTLQIGALGTNTTFAGIIANGATKTIAMEKVGSGILTLSGANTYTGSTLVSAGTLLVNGSLGNTAVSATGGTLGGTGTITSTVSVTGTGTVLSPGASIESLATGALTMGSGTVLAYEAANASSTGADLLAVNGTLSLTGVTLDLSGADLAALTWLPGDKITLISYNGTPITSGFTGFTDDTTYFFGSNEWLFDYNDTVAGTNFTTDATAAGTSFVTLTVIPEPSAALLGGLGVLALLRRRRR